VTTKTKRSVLKARIRVLEAEAANLRRWDEGRRVMNVRAQAALNDIGAVLTYITASTIACDKSAVGDFAQMLITTPTTIMLADKAMKALEQNAADFRTLDQGGTV
jgi:hypothetical protein